MLSTTSGLAPLVLAGLLGWTGAVKLLSRGTALAAPKTALARMLRDSERATLVLRAVGAGELLLTALLLTVPGTALPGAALPGVAAAVLGAGFAGYLGYGRAVAPGSTCGCSASEDTPITWRAFARAGAVLAGGAVAAMAPDPWWAVAGERPAASAAFLAVAAAVLVALSADLDRWWLLPLRRTRLRALGHPLAGTASGGPVPVAATVELLERSLAWQALSPVVRSGLLDSWVEDGWRILEYSGVYEDGVYGGGADADGAGASARPVSVVFALDAGAGLDTPGDPVVRVTVLDAGSGEPVAAESLHSIRARTTLPVAG